jgi:hypothetical protein
MVKHLKVAQANHGQSGNGEGMQNHDGTGLQSGQPIAFLLPHMHVGILYMWYWIEICEMLKLAVDKLPTSVGVSLCFVPSVLSTLTPHKSLEKKGKMASLMQKMMLVT